MFVSVPSNALHCSIGVLSCQYHATFGTMPTDHSPLMGTNENVARLQPPQCVERRQWAKGAHIPSSRACGVRPCCSPWSLLAIWEVLQMAIPVLFKGGGPVGQHCWTISSLLNSVIYVVFNLQVSSFKLMFLYQGVCSSLFSN